MIYISSVLKRKTDIPDAVMILGKLKIVPWYGGDDVEGLRVGLVGHFLLPKNS